MDYAFYAIACLISIAFVLCYNKLNTTQQTLILAHARLDNCINSQTAVAFRLAVYVGHLTCTPSMETLSTLSHRIQAIRILGRHAVDQSAETYDILHALVQTIVRNQHEFEIGHLLKLLTDFEEGHVQQQHVRALYNKAALTYNDCQRNAIQNWLALHLGYEMAPPC